MAADLNLTRKWRPKSFDEIVGQGLSIRMLKNGLYLKKFFPLYIFSGQRGCGKTTTARVFAAALNCLNLLGFQKDPKNNIVPCGACSSCISMSGGRHPDFIEMDAASHTGVDNVRQILESASFIPISGGSKIYLIDEAHMLSKAAFNAFLKILEEPPHGVFFILATTELHKIPDTVCSRAFQVFFNAIDEKDLTPHLNEICSREDIQIEDDALEVIIAESGGSARDAINLLERVRLLNGNMTKEVVMQCLGKIGEEKLFKLFGLLLEKNKQGLFEFLAEISFNKITPQFLWEALVNLCRALVWIKHGTTKLPYPYNNKMDQVKKLATGCSINRLSAIMQLFFTQEELFLKTTQKHLFLETVLLQICGQVNVVDLEALVDTLGRAPSSDKHLPMAPQDNVQEKRIVSSGPWERFLESATTLDPALLSIFKQVSFVEFNADKKIVLRLPNNSGFFRDKIQEGEESVKVAMAEVFPEFDGFAFAEVEKKAKQVSPRQSSTTVKTTIPKSPSTTRGRFMSVSDREKWPKANLLVNQFSGKIEVVVE